MRTIEVGSRVSYAKPWLRSTQAHHLGHATGTVERIDAHLAYVRWDNNTDEVKPVIVRNLVLTNRKHLELY